jgi:uncharacterized DUF497 family protein/uncharacterized protein (DUF4415 family)
MEDRRIIWDEAKNAENKAKHKIGFEVAQYVFSDPLRIWRLDMSEKSTASETRWQTIGKVGKVFFVVYTEQEDGVENITALFRREMQKSMRGGVTMGTIKSTIKVGQKIPKEILELAKNQFKEAQKAPKVHDLDCPPSSPEALAEFAAMARELRKNHRNHSSVVALRVKPDALSKYKALGKGYTSIMADVLNYVAENPELLSKVHV